jgi:hypothetical protein
MVTCTGEPQRVPRRRVFSRGRDLSHFLHCLVIFFKTFFLHFYKACGYVQCAAVFAGVAIGTKRQ